MNTNVGLKDSKGDMLNADQNAEQPEPEDAAACKIEELPDNCGYKLALQIPKAFYGGFMKGHTKRHIEAATETEIYVPRRSEKSSSLIIKGKERGNLCTALHKIRLLVDTLRKKMRPTHFLAVPLNTGAMQKQFLALKKCILEAQLPGIDTDLFISERCLHLTLGVYVLLDGRERENAMKELQMCRQYFTESYKSFHLNIRGLEIMNDNPSSTRVVYARVEAPELQEFADKCLKHFKQTGLCASAESKRDNVKLHMTILNNRYRKKLNKQSSNSFDAREIIKRFGDYDLGVAQCDEVHLCELGSSGKVNYFYKITGTLKFEDTINTNNN
ncbi:activating signal cointegrator 1 complex subunit 1-like [Scaptodrosophila lebanonensis]|uniref:Activating signal cointegrator 1 complex subunit 1-like n=1 Tax=Drosophila lebanonensis TaxID=7225 RepID=A0A6J2UGI6_DROLE|nr:activating signal cointegrator 1 complex subunit 1-like [Scaptodrosophila lebanonensis]